MKNENPASLHLIELFRMTKFLASKYDLPMPDEKDLRNNYAQLYAAPVFLRNSSGSLWVDRYYLAYQLESTGEFRYVYMTKYHINEEVSGYRRAAKERGGDNLMPEDIRRFAVKALRVMNARGSALWVDEKEFRGMKTERWIQLRQVSSNRDSATSLKMQA